MPPNPHRNLVCIALPIIGLLAVFFGGPVSPRQAEPPQSTVNWPPMATCSQGKVTLGKNPGVINFQAKCQARVKAPAIGGRFSFFISSSPISRHRLLVDIRGFEERPKTYGPGAISPHGRCGIDRGVVSCLALANGAFTIKGRIWVSPSRRCKAGVDFSVVRPSACSATICPFGLGLRGLAEGRPQGCSDGSVLGP
jgi:hypothetical protein